MELDRKVIAIAVAVMAIFVTNPWAFAVEVRDDSSNEFSRSLEEMRQTLRKTLPSLQDKLKKYTDDLKNVKPTDFDFSDNKMYPEEELTRDVREIQFPAQSLTQIQFSERLGNDNIRVVKSQDNTITILVSVLADPEHKQLVTSLSNSLHSRMEGQKVVIFERNSSYGCITSTINGVMRLKGACYTAITVAMPEDKKISIYNGNKRIYGPAQAMTVKELINGLEEGFSNDKLKLIETFKSTATAETQLTSKEMEQILEEFTSDNEKLEALKKLVSYLDLDQKAAFSERISDIFISGSKQNVAYRILVSGR